jgi:hypothetical protein
MFSSFTGGSNLAGCVPSPNARPAHEEVCEEADDDTVLRKDRDGHVIGFEKLNVDLSGGVRGRIVEVLTTSTEAN